MSSAACAGVTVDQGTRALARRAGRHLLGDEGVRRAHPDEASLEGRARAANSRLSILVIDRHSDAGEEGADGQREAEHLGGEGRAEHDEQREQAEQVGRAHVCRAVEHARDDAARDERRLGVVPELETVGDLLRDLECFVDGNRAARDACRNVLSLDVFHREEANSRLP